MLSCSLKLLVKGSKCRYYNLKFDHFNFKYEISYVNKIDKKENTKSAAH
jgi:hypothetical protein